jgi:hypothetical protein
MKKMMVSMMKMMMVMVVKMIMIMMKRKNFKEMEMVTSLIQSLEQEKEAISLEVILLKRIEAVVRQEINQLLEVPRVQRPTMREI